MIVGVFGLLTMFIFNYYGKIATESFEKMGECVFECDWYEFPFNFQKNFVLMIAITKKPLRYHGCGLMPLSLDTFRTVRNTQTPSD